MSTNTLTFDKTERITFYGIVQKLSEYRLVWYSNGRCLVVKWWLENRTEKNLFMVQNVQYSNGLLSHMTLPFEYWTPIPSGI